MITTASIPESLRNDRQVAPFIARSVELQDVNPVVSYYCKLYVLEHILSQKLHQNGKDIESFTMALLDDTESTKASPDDESVRQVLASKQLSLNLVFIFAFKLFNGCLEDLSNYDGVSKPRLAHKLRATINFWSLFALFSAPNELDPVDYDQTTAGQCKTEEEFLAFTKDKAKTLKYQLSRLLKDEIPIKGEEQELDALAHDTDSLNIQAGEFDATQDANTPSGPSDQPDGAGVPNSGKTPQSVPSTEDFEQIPNDSKSNAFSLPEPPKTDPGSDVQDDSDPGTESHNAGNPGNPGNSGNSGNPGFTLPGAPKFDPSIENDSDAEANDLKLPGAPSLLPDDDLSKVNKKSSIQVFPPQNDKPTPAPVRPNVEPKRSVSSNVVHVTRESLPDLVDTTEQIGKIQKHAKFAISALNYEDFNTAEAELLKGLELLRSIKSRK
ncbi:hypothetical protein JCM33374_g2258 [Metschnikowia sp. JCM 33374]|nr:hypothetical protein JCM33374_g2258 [Metschnikowia sp. JCM 33374]